MDHRLNETASQKVHEAKFLSISRVCEQLIRDRLSGVSGLSGFALALAGGDSVNRI
jgi:hypothetical protein